MPKSVELLEQWKSEIRKAIKYREDFALSKSWKRYYAYYRGQKRSGIYSVNKYFSMLRSGIPRIYFRNPKIVAAPTRPGFEASAAVVQSVDNHILREINIKQTMKAVVQDAFFCNKGFVKVGYSREFGALPQVGTKTLPADEDIEYNVSVKEGMPWALRTSPESFLVKWGTSTLNDVQWVAHKVVRLLDDVKKDPMYVNTSKLQGGYVRELRGKKEGEMLVSEQTKSSQQVQLSSKGEEGEQWVEIYEIRDAKRGEILAINLDHDKFLRSPSKDELQIEGVPYVDLCFNPDNDVFWGPSDATLLESHQKEINDVKSQISMHRRINLIKFLYDSDLLTKEKFEALMSGQIGGGLGIPGVTKNAIIALQPGEPLILKQDAIEIERDINETLGFPRTEAGEYAGPPRRTAKEVEQVSQAHWIRMDERRDLLADFLVNVVRKINQIIFTNWTTEHVAPVVGPDKAIYWVKYTGAQIMGEYDFTVNIDTGKPITMDTRRAEAERILDKVKGDPNAAQFVNVQELWKNALSLYDWIDVDKIMKTSQTGAQVTDMAGLQQMFGRGA
ncbi:hypothetical protein LCGC14_0611300 [marine sediment metagenome]|uniref:Portal protein n=1 Tax=marine sediment metagenome TaxID=412755 RepID=A0A0F9UG51_9ZZZZ